MEKDVRDNFLAIYGLLAEFLREKYSGKIVLVSDRYLVFDPYIHFDEFQQSDEYNFYVTSYDTIIDLAENKITRKKHKIVIENPKHNSENATSVLTEITILSGQEAFHKLVDVETILEDDVEVFTNRLSILKDKCIPLSPVDQEIDRNSSSV